MTRQVPAIIEALGRQGIAVDIAGIKPRPEEKLSTVRLRFDKVALQFVEGLQPALNEVVPDGKTVIVTITAPIRMASKTAAAVEKKVRSSLARRPVRVDLAETIHGNHIRVRLVNGVSNGARVIGFVHNPDSDPNILFDVTRSLLPRSRSARGGENQNDKSRLR